jgi:hypothetical protein
MDVDSVLAEPPVFGLDEGPVIDFKLEDPYAFDTSMPIDFDCGYDGLETTASTASTPVSDLLVDTLPTTDPLFDDFDLQYGLDLPSGDESDSSSGSAPSLSSTVAEVEPMAPPPSTDASGEGKSRKRRRPSKKNTPSKARKVGENTSPAAIIERKSFTKSELADLTIPALDSLLTQPWLTSEQQNLIRRQLRLAKNRESAHISRERKKNYVAELEEQVAKLQRENSKLSGDVSGLEAENSKLRSKLSGLTSYVTSAGLSDLLHKGADFLTGLASAQTEESSSTPGTPTSSPTVPSFLNRNKAVVRNTGVLLFVFMFAFGLMFTPKEVTPQAAPEPAPSSGRIVDHHAFRPTARSNDRDVLHLLEEQNIPTQRLRDRMAKERALPVNSASVAPKEEVPKTVISVPTSEEEYSEDGVSVSVGSTDYVPVIKSYRANTTYLHCPEVEIIPVPENKVIEVENAPRQFSFLIPPDSIDSATEDCSSEECPETSYLEVVCQVIEINSVPAVERRYESNPSAPLQV